MSVSIPLGDGGKRHTRRNENRAAVEANWPTNWNARDLSCVHGDEVQVSQADGPGSVQETNPPTTGS